jgi:hypothetical protein
MMAVIVQQESWSRNQERRRGMQSGHQFALSRSPSLFLPMTAHLRRPSSSSSRNASSLDDQTQHSRWCDNNNNSTQTRIAQSHRAKPQDNNNNNNNNSSSSSSTCMSTLPPNQLQQCGTFRVHLASTFSRNRSLGSGRR